MGKAFIAESTDAPNFHGGALSFWEYKGPECVLSGPYECVAGETLIYNPVENKETPIEELARMGEHLHVLTLRGVRKAGVPFKKGVAKLYRVMTDDGQSFVATAHHRVLTPVGWRMVCELSVGTLLQILPASTEGLFRREFLSGVRCSSDRPVDCLDGCFACCRPSDARPHLVQGIDRAFVPSRAGVHEHSCAGRHADDRVSLSEYNHPDRLHDHPSIGHLEARCAAVSRREYCASLEMSGLSDVLNQASYPFALGSNLHLSTASTEEYRRLLPAYSLPVTSEYGTHESHNYTGYTSAVSSIEYERTGEYYDIHVPGIGHYYAEGFIHHNTGKTFAALNKLHLLLCLFPKCRALMVRKTYKSCVGSAVVTYEQKVLPVPPEHHKSAVAKYGGEKPEFYQYPNGSRLVVGGMDNPDKFLSAEYDFIYVNQAEELRLDDWEKLTGRATGRAGNAPWTQVMGDCNPDAPTHWIKQRERLKIFESRHEDNPRLYSREARQWTEAGTKTLDTLNALTGVRLKRGRFGLWVAAEGQIYEYDPAVHLVPRFRIPDSWRRIRVIDFGYTNPFVCHWWAIDDDGRMYLYRQMYMSQRTVRRHSGQIRELSAGETIEATVCDHDAEDRATLEENGIYCIPADKRVKVGIEKTQERLAKAGDGKPRIFFLEDSLVEVDSDLQAIFKPVKTEDEFATYVWAKTPDGKPNKDEPLKLDDHGCDGTRYAVMYADISQGMEFA